VSLRVSIQSLLGNGSVPAATNTPTIEESLDASFFMWSESYQRRVCSLSVYSVSLLGKSLVKTFPRLGRIIGGVIFYAVRVVLNESRLLVLPKTFCLFELLKRNFLTNMTMMSIIKTLISRNIVRCNLTIRKSSNERGSF
jgi:hypothetical protein